MSAALAGRQRLCPKIQTSTHSPHTRIHPPLRPPQTWGKTTGAHRAAILRKVAEGVRVRRGELATTESLDMGKPIDEAEWDMDDVATCFDYYAGLAEKLDAAQETPVELPDSRFATVIRREPLGVVLAITPWNYPLLMATWKVRSRSPPDLRRRCVRVQRLYLLLSRGGPAG